MTKERIVVAGATGFIGKQLLQSHPNTHDWIALSRRARPEDSNSSVEWRACDLFSMLDAEKGVEGAKYGIYLVHSMMPSARLTQGDFADLDLIAADNFARAAAKAGLEQIIFIGGIVPQDCQDDPSRLSSHLLSRFEVEKTLGAYGVPVTTLRAGLILGAEGSSFQMLKRLVKRLPMMICPSWTNTRSHPIAVNDVVALLLYCLGNSSTYGEAYEIGGEDEVSYRELIQETAKLLGLHRRVLGVPFVTPALSRLWVSLVTGAPKELVSPLIQSLHHDMRVHDRRLQQQANLPITPLRKALEDSLSPNLQKSVQPVAYLKPVKRSTVSEVRSVQRMPLPIPHDAQFVAKEYMRWLPRLLPWFLRVDIDEDSICHFRVRWLPIVLLKLQFSPERSQPDRQLFYIRGGVLAHEQGRGRLEFREVLSGKNIVAAIHEYRPTLPWYIYRLTQALVHLWVMRRFGNRLEDLKLQPYQGA